MYLKKKIKFMSIEDMEIIENKVIIKINGEWICYCCTDNREKIVELYKLLRTK